jgi:RNA polymerase sigma-70 factor (ECF subfamily)
MSHDVDVFSADKSVAFCRLFDAHADGMRRYAQRIVRSRDSAEDVVQDVFFRLWRVWERVDVGDGIRSYLFITTRSRALSALRRMKSVEARERLFAPEEVMPDDSASLADDAASEEVADVSRAIERVLAMMTPRQREVAILRHRRQLTTAEIARRLQISPRTVEHHAASATKTLRAHLPGLLRRDGRRSDGRVSGSAVCGRRKRTSK